MIKYLAVIIVLTYVGGVPVLAQTAGRTYTLQGMSAQDINTLGRGLAKLPYEESAVLIGKLQQQISEQDTAAGKPEPSGQSGATVKGKR